MALGTLFSYLQMGGTALSIAGMVTGNEKLSKVGMIAGAVGGLGSLAASTGLIDGAKTVGGVLGAGEAGAGGDAIVSPASSTDVSGPEGFKTASDMSNAPANSGDALTKLRQEGFTGPQGQYVDPASGGTTDALTKLRQEGFTGPQGQLESPSDKLLREARENGTLNPATFDKDGNAF
jgi:hypothetical protein